MKFNPNYIIVYRGQRNKLLEGMIRKLDIQPLEFFAAERNYSVGQIDDEMVLNYNCSFMMKKHAIPMVARIVGVLDVYVLIGQDQLDAFHRLPMSRAIAEVRGGLLCRL